MQHIVSGFDEPSLDDESQGAGARAVYSEGAGAEFSSIPDRLLDQWGFPIQVCHGGGWINRSMCLRVGTFNLNFYKEIFDVCLDLATVSGRTPMELNT